MLLFPQSFLQSLDMFFYFSDFHGWRKDFPFDLWMISRKSTELGSVGLGGISSCIPSRIIIHPYVSLVAQGLSHLLLLLLLSRDRSQCSFHSSRLRKSGEYQTSGSATQCMKYSRIWARTGVVLHKAWSGGGCRRFLLNKFTLTKLDVQIIIWWWLEDYMVF